MGHSSGAEGKGAKASARPDGDRMLGLAALGLAVLSFLPYLGLLFLPACLLAGVALFGRPARALAGIGLALASVRFLGAAVQWPALPPVTPSVLQRPYASAAMANFGLPPLPPSAGHIRLRAGGLFAKHVFLAFEAPEAEVRGFLQRLGPAEEHEVGAEAYRIASTVGESEAMNAAMVAGEAPDVSRLVRVPTPTWLPWFRPDETQVGWVAARADPEASGFILCFDGKQSRACFYWHHD